MPRRSQVLASPTALVLGAAVVSGASGYGALLLAARLLSPADNADFLVFWGLAFGLYGVLIGCTTEVTRAVNGATPAATMAVLPITLGAACAIVVTVGLSGLVWAPHLLGADWGRLLGASVLAGALFSMHVILSGVASGRGAWSTYSLLVSGEAALRFALFVVVALVSVTVTNFAVASAMASGFWLLATVASRRYRALWSQRVDLTRSGLVRRLVAACAASGVSSLLLVGYPVLVRVTTTDAVFAHAAPIILAVSLCRAPLLVPLGAYQNVVITRVAVHGLRAIVPAAVLVISLTLVGAVLAWPIGPWALRLVNPDYHLAPPVFTALVLGAGLVALLTVTGAAVVGLDRHGLYLAGWMVATVGTLVALMIPGSLESRVVSSLFVGPAAGVALHLWGARTRIG